MEVHHHPIAIGSHCARKKWTHYFWEFLMLFLAVFCGTKLAEIFYLDQLKSKANNLVALIKKEYRIN